MNTLVNKVQLIGRLGMDPEVRTFDKSKMARMSLATDASYMRNGERVKDAHWHTLVAWGSTAERANKLLKKGKQIAINGKLVNRTYTDKDGIQRTATEVHVSDFKLLGSNKDQ
jgi:single-strand DNA-binding protein